MEEIDDWMDLSKFNNDNANQVVNYIIVTICQLTQ